MSCPTRSARSIGVMSSLPLDGDPRSDDDDAGTRPGGQPYASSVLLRQTNTVKTVADRRPGDRSRHPGAAGGRGAEPVARDAVCDRPVRHARRQADGDGRSVERGAGGDALARPGCRRPTPTSDLKTLFDAWGIEFDPTQGGRRPDRRLARAGRRRRPGAGGELCRLVQYPRRDQPRRSGDRRSAAGDGGLVGVSGEGAERVDRLHPVADQQRPQRRDPGATRSRCRTRPRCWPVSSRRAARG